MNQLKSFSMLCIQQTGINWREDYIIHSDSSITPSRTYLEVALKSCNTMDSFLRRVHHKADTLYTAETDFDPIL